MVLSQGIEVLNGSMKAGDPDIIKAGGAMSEELKSDVGLFGNGMIGGSGSTNGHLEGWKSGGVVPTRWQSECLGERVVLSLRKKTTEVLGFLGVNTSR
jgi:hypothetical protein